MKPSRLRTFVLGLIGGVAYAFLCLLIVKKAEVMVSVSYIFVVPLVLGAIPALFSTREQLRSYKNYLLIPVLSVLSFFYLSFLNAFDGLICLVVIIGPFIILGAIGAFLARLISLRNSDKKTPLYCSLLLPFLALLLESNFQATDHFYTVTTSINIEAPRPTVWTNIKNVRNIQPSEIPTHFVHIIGVPRPLDGVLDHEGIGGTRSITWEKGIRFREVIKSWQEGDGFSYDIHVDPRSIPPTTLDEHVMVGGKYFDVVEGSYHIDSLGTTRQRLTLTCRYRVTTNLGFYSKWWADLMLGDFNAMILEVIKKRCENKTR